MSKASAPRKKKDKDTVVRHPRGTKLSTSARICNKDKFNKVACMLDRLMSLKKSVSAVVHRDLHALFLDGYAIKKTGYKSIISNDLNAWETQALHHDICSDYQRKLEDLFGAQKFFMQRGFTSEKYQRTVTRKCNDGASVVVARAGDIKPDSFLLFTQQTPLTSIANYLTRCNLDTFDPSSLADDHKLKPAMLRIAAKMSLWDRLVALVKVRQQRLIGYISPIQYRTGTHRRHPIQSNSKVIIDTSNGQYNVFLQIRIGLGKEQELVHLPLLFSKKRLREIANGNLAELALDREFRLKSTGRKIHVCTTYDAIAPQFAEKNRVLGIDVNSKHNLLADSEGAFYSLPALHFERLLGLLTKIDANGGVAAMNWRRQAQLKKALRANESAIQKQLRHWLDGWLADGVTDIWMEDLALSHDATMIRHHAFGEKYSRMTRLLRLSKVKEWMQSMAEKRGIRVHTSNAAYSSQECPMCHHVSRNNRLTQEEFNCEECGFVANADTAAGMNMKYRGVSDVLRSTLHVFDKHGRASPNKNSRLELKRILIAQEKNKTEGGVTELLTPSLKNKRGAAKSASF